MDLNELSDKIKKIDLIELIKELHPSLETQDVKSYEGGLINNSKCVFTQPTKISPFYFNENAFYCFDCGKKGNQYTFLKESFVYAKTKNAVETYILKKLNLEQTSKNITLIQEAENNNLLELDDDEIKKLYLGNFNVGKLFLREENYF